MKQVGPGHAQPWQCGGWLPQLFAHVCWPSTAAALATSRGHPLCSYGNRLCVRPPPWPCLQALAAAEQEAARLRQQISEAKASVAEALQFVKAADGHAKQQAAAAQAAEREVAAARAAAEEAEKRTQAAQAEAASSAQLVGALLTRQLYADLEQARQQLGQQPPPAEQPQAVPPAVQFSVPWVPQPQLQAANPALLAMLQQMQQMQRL